MENNSNGIAIPKVGFDMPVTDLIMEMENAYFSLYLILAQH